MSVGQKSSQKFSILLALVAMVAASGCGSKKVKPDETAVPEAVGADVNPMGDSDTGNALGLQSINFPFDSFTLTAVARASLKSNAETMKSNSAMRVQIEGHCDNRGGIQYNLALGEKRANAVRKYMMDLGIAGDSVSIISFGKERPLVEGDNEDAWAKNRRANFVITSR